MDIQLKLTDSTLSTEEKAVVNALNQFFSWLPAKDDPQVVLRLGALLLEAANVSSQPRRAEAAGFSQSRSVRVYKQRLQSEGLTGILKRPIPGRPAISRQPDVEQLVIQMMLQAAIEEQSLPKDDILAERVQGRLSQTQPELARQVTSSLVQQIRLRWGIHRLPLRRQATAQREEQLPQESLLETASPVAPTLGLKLEKKWPAWLLEETPPEQLWPELKTSVEVQLAWLWEDEWPVWLPQPLLSPPNCPLAKATLPETLSSPKEKTPLPAIEPAAEAAESTNPANQTPKIAPLPDHPMSPNQQFSKDAIQLGRTQVGGACILACLLAQMEWPHHLKKLSFDEKYAVTPQQWALTAIFGTIFGLRRSTHLDDVSDVGFALLTGRARPLSRATFQHLLHTISDTSTQQFYLATAKTNVEELAQGERRLSIDGHNLPRYTRLVEVQKGKIGNTGRINKADELVLAFDLDAKVWLALRTYPGTNHLNRALPEMVKELLNHRPAEAGSWRLFFDKGGYCGRTFHHLKQVERLHFYTPAVRHSSNLKQWEALTAADFAPLPFTYDKHATLPPAQRPTYRLADKQMSINIRENNKVVDTVTLRAIILHDPTGQKPAERWPFVLLTDDWERAPDFLLNEYGDHWAQEFAHRIGRHDLCLDVLPQGYHLHSWRDENGQLQRETTPNQTALFLLAWLRCQTFNLMSTFAQALDPDFQKMWAGTLLRLFIRRPATLYLVDKELHVVFDRFPKQQALQPLLDKLNAARIAIPWLNQLVFQFHLTSSQPLYPLQDPKLRNRLFQRD